MQRCLPLLQPSQEGRRGWEVEVLVGGGGTRRSDGKGDGALHYLVDVPFLTSQMLHLNASAVFLKVHTLQSQ